MKLKSLFAFLALSVLSSTGFASASPFLQANFQLDNTDNTSYTGTITLKNNSDHALTNWQLAFNFIRAFTSIEEGNIVKQTGDFFILEPDENHSHTLAAHDSFTFHVKGKWTITHNMEAPAGYFVILHNPETKAERILPVTAIPLSLNITPTANKQPINPSSTTTLDETRIIPRPASLQRVPGQFILNTKTRIYADAKAKATANFFIHAIETPTQYHLQLAQTSGDKTNTIILTTVGADTSLGAEGYILEVLPKTITIRATDARGFFYGIQSLRQLLPPAIYAHRAIQNTTWTIPALIIYDTPHYPYRGLHLDVARHFIPKNEVLRLLDLMAIHKLNQFHWHLTDDQGWRIEIKHYPSLTKIGAWRGYNRSLPPALGSGYKPYGGYYTQEDIREIVRYATLRHIQVIPEIDIPGHARALIMSLPEALIDPDDQSVYGSLHAYHDNVLNPCMESTYHVLNTIFAEVTTLFPNAYIHVGADEVPDGVWMKSPRCIERMQALNIHSVDGLQHDFLTRIQEMLLKHHKTMAGWEEIRLGGELNRSTQLYAWSDAKHGLKAAELGYPVVMMPAPYFYFDIVYNNDPKEPGGTWSTPVYTYKTYSWKMKSAPNIVGVEGALWSENINSRKQLDYFAFPRVFALAEVAWTPEPQRDWANFLDRVTHLHLQRLNYYGVQYRQGEI